MITHNKNYYLHVRVTKLEIERYRRAAKELGLNVSSLTRFTLNNYISKTKKTMKESINITVDANQKKKLIEQAHKRNLSIREYLRLLVNNL